MARRCWGSQSGSAASSNLCRLFFLNRRVGAHGGRLAQIRDRSLAKSLICHEIGICERTTEHNQSGSTFVLEQVLILRQFTFVSVLLIFAVWLGYPLASFPDTPPTKVHYNVLSQSSYEGRDFIIRESTIEPGAAIGWHWHQGTVFAVVKEGTLHHYRKDCTVDAVYKPGDSFLEFSGADNVHDGRNFGTTRVVLEVIYIVPAGTPLADAATPPTRCRDV